VVVSSDGAALRVRFRYTAVEKDGHRHEGWRVGETSLGPVTGIHFPTDGSGLV